MVVISPDAATRHGRRWVVLPLSTVSDLASNPLAYRLAPTATNGLGPLGRLTSAELTAIAASVIQALDLQGLEPWQLDPEA